MDCLIKAGLVFPVLADLFPPLKFLVAEHGDFSDGAL